MRKFNEIKDEMKKTWESKDGGEGEEYVFFKKTNPTDKKAKRLLQNGEFFLFELTDKLSNNHKQVADGDQQYEKSWTFGYFVNSDKTRINAEPVKLTFTPAVARNIVSYLDKFGVSFEAGDTYRFFDNDYKGKYGMVYGVGCGIVKKAGAEKSDKKVEVQNKEAKAVVDMDIEEIDIGDDLL